MCFSFHKASYGDVCALLLQAPKSQLEIEREQEALLRAKYGGLQPKKKLIPKVHGALGLISQQLTAMREVSFVSGL